MHFTKQLALIPSDGAVYTVERGKPAPDDELGKAAVGL